MKLLPMVICLLGMSLLSACAGNGNNSELATVPSSSSHTQHPNAAANTAARMIAPVT